MEQILAQMQSMILAEHHGKLQCLEKECSALRNELADKESASAALPSTRKRRRTEKSSVPETSTPTIGCAMVLCSQPCSVEVIDATAEQLTMHIHHQVLRQVPYFNTARVFAEKAGTQSEKLRIRLPGGCPCTCAALVFSRLYLGDGCPFGSCALPISSLAEALAAGKLADMLMLEHLFKEIESIARRLARQGADVEVDLRDASLPEFLQSLATQMLQAPQLSESDLTDMLQNVASAKANRSEAEKLLASNPHAGASVASALIAIAQETLDREERRQRRSYFFRQRDQHEPLSWLLNLAELHIEDPVGMVSFFEAVSSMQGRTITKALGLLHFEERHSFDRRASEVLRKAFINHLVKCSDCDTLIRYSSIVTQMKAMKVIEETLEFKVTKDSTNILFAQYLENAVFPQLLARGALLGCRKHLMKQVSEFPADVLQHVCSPQFLSLLTPEEELEICKQIVTSSRLHVWATVPVISALALDARRFVCTRLSSCLGNLGDEVRDIVLREVR